MAGKPYVVRGRTQGITFLHLGSVGIVNKKFGSNSFAKSNFYIFLMA